MPLGAGNKVVPDRMWSHRPVNIITVTLSPGARHSNFGQGAREGMIDRGKDERCIEKKGGSEKE